MAVPIQAVYVRTKRVLGELLSRDPRLIRADQKLETDLRIDSGHARDTLARRLIREFHGEIPIDRAAIKTSMRDTVRVLTWAVYRSQPEVAA